MTATLPAGITIRAPKMDDAEAVVDLINTCAVAEGGEADENVSELLADWKSGEISLETDIWLAIAPNGKIIGYEESRPDESNPTVMVDGYVHPDYANQGIGTYLLHLAEERARTLLDATQSEVILRSHTNMANAHASQLFANAQYTFVRRFWRMEIEMEQAPAFQYPAGITIRTFVPDQDERVFHSVIEESFAEHWGHSPTSFESWVQKLPHREDYVPSLWFLAFDGDTAVGAVLCYDREVFGWIRSLGVLVPWRKRGVGSALLYHVFDAFYQRGQYRVSLGVDAENETGATRLYEQVGMSVAEQYDTYEKKLTLS
ncbi:MAG: GNAT family N-acetyltransferase [Chloroflexota bacterium]